MIAEDRAAHGVVKYFNESDVMYCVLRNTEYTVELYG